MSDVKEVFSEIYRTHSWQGTSRSGPGSDPAKTTRYRELVKHVLQAHPISSVVDVGCGDWSSSRLINWSNVDYTGVDLVPELVDHLNAEFGSDQRRFMVANLIQDELPSADLCIIKDVLQHLSNAAVQSFIIQQLPRFRYALITNDARVFRLLQLLRPWRIPKANVDIPNGGARSLRLTFPPFNLKAKRLDWYRVFHGQIVFEKEVLFWDRANG